MGNGSLWKRERLDLRKQSEVHPKLASHRKWCNWPGDNQCLASLSAANNVDYESLGAHNVIPGAAGPILFNMVGMTIYLVDNLYIVSIHL